jgi:hypothetical protein
MQDFHADFEKTIDDSANRLLQISEAQSGQPRAEDKWSSKQIIGHLIDSATNNHVRFVNAQLSDDLIFAGYDQEKWVQANGYQERVWTELVNDWQLCNRRLLHMIDLIPDRDLKKERARHSLDQIAWQMVPKDQPTTLEYLIRDYLAHMKSHLRQILGNVD